MGASKSKSRQISPEPALKRWEPIVLTFDYEWQGCGPCAEPCMFPCCCCYLCGNYPAFPCCMSQRDKAVAVHNRLMQSYVKDGIFGAGAVAVSFRWEETEKGFKATEIFRNMDAAEAYYSHFTSNTCMMMYVISNLPWRQKQGPTAVVSDGNVKAWITAPKDELKTVLATGEQTVKYNHLGLEGGVEVEQWTTAPSIEELEKQFGNFHYGWHNKVSLAETDGSGKSPKQQKMEG